MSLRSNSALKRVLGEQVKAYCDSSEPNGDCFYLCVEKAHDHIYSVTVLREMVSEAVDETLLQSYRACAAASIKGYHWMTSIKTVDDLKQRFLILGKDNRKKSVWADEFAINTISKLLQVSFLIYDHATKGYQRCGDSEERFIVLELTRRQHYNLIRFNEERRAISTKYQLEESVRARWKLD